MSKTTLIVAALFVFGLGAFVWNGTRPPETAEHSVSSPSPGQAAGAPIVEVTLPADLSANAEIGKRAFEAKCAVCHGADAAGQNGVAPPLVHKIYEPSHHADMAFVRAVQNGVRAHHWNFGNMPPVEGLTQGDVKMIATYVRELQRANGID